MKVKDFAVCYLDCNYEEAKSFYKLLGVFDNLYDIMKKNDWDLYFAHCNTVLTSSDVAKMTDVIKALLDSADSEFYLQKL